MLLFTKIEVNTGGYIVLAEAVSGEGNIYDSSLALK